MFQTYKQLSRSVETVVDSSVGNFEETVFVDGDIHSLAVEANLNGAVVVETEYLGGLAVLNLRP